MLRITRVEPLFGYQFNLDFFDRIPVSFQSDSPALRGARHVFYRASAGGLLEVKISALSYQVRGFSLVVASRFDPDPLVGPDSITTGFPIIALPNGITFDEKAVVPRVDIPAELAIYIGRDSIDIRIGESSDCDSGVRYERVTFLARQGVLAGIRMSDLTEREITEFKLNLQV